MKADDLLAARHSPFAAQSLPRKLLQERQYAITSRGGQPNNIASCHDADRLHRPTVSPVPRSMAGPKADRRDDTPALARLRVVGGEVEGDEATRHHRAGRGRDPHAILVRHVDHGHPLDIAVRVHPLDETFLRAHAQAREG